ncbi:MAG: hypothetical protein LBH12_05395 [Dysgonamonadaceae bacterium]|jgi:hypothetical protein|nr:hypothetical protein [Dysgonamonadaceae bacterium]
MINKTITNIRKAIFLFPFLFLILSYNTGFAQSNSTTSPYTQFGYGQIADQSFGSQRAMGGIGYGLRNSKMINTLNPASFSSVDSMTFMLDLAVKGETGRLKEGNNKANRRTASFEYIAIQFPLVKSLGMGIGLAPVSHVGYQFQSLQRIDQYEEEAYVNYTGKGGLKKIYTTLSYSLFDRFAIGVNVGYLFGDIIKESSSFPNVPNSHRLVWNDTLRTGGLTYEAGIQYSIPLKNKHKDELVLGAVYSPKISPDSKKRSGKLSYTGGSVTGNPETSVSKVDFHLPETFGGGVTLNRPDKFTAGADFQYQKWSDTRYDKLFTNGNLSDRFKINAGAEYIPNHTGNLLNRIRYRAGGYYTNSYIKVDDKYGYKDYGVTLGFGIPLVDRRSFVNLTFEYNIISPEKRPEVTMINEQYFRFIFSYTFNELWFFKRKLQ